MLRAIKSRDATATAPQRGRLRLSISTGLIAGICGLVFAGCAAALAVGLCDAAPNTMGLLADKAELSAGGLTRSMRQHLDPVSHGSAFLADLIRRGEIDVGIPSSWSIT